MLGVGVSRYGAARARYDVAVVLFTEQSIQLVTGRPLPPEVGVTGSRKPRRASGARVRAHACGKARPRARSLFGAPRPCTRHTAPHYTAPHHHRGANDSSTFKSTLCAQLVIAISQCSHSV